MRVVVLGSGGVGGYFGGRLAASGADVVFVARGAHLEALQTTGLRIRSPKGDLHLPQVRATGEPTGPADVVLFAVKLYDNEAAASLLPPLIGADTVVVPLQNGVESVEFLAGRVGCEHVAGGTAYISAVVAGPGQIRHTAFDQLVFGELDGTRTPRLERLLEACRTAGFEAKISDQIELDIWSKFVRLSVFSGMTAVTRCPIGLVREDPDLAAMMQAAWLESMAVARAKGVPIPSGTLDGMIRTAEALPPHAKSSMLEDLEQGRRLELPWLSGAVVRFGERLGIETPTHRFITTVLKPYVTGRPL
jgi:2-dehydropantoate 2-reductase